MGRTATFPLQRTSSRPHRSECGQEGTLTLCTTTPTYLLCAISIGSAELEIAGLVEINCRIRDSQALPGGAMSTTEVVKLYGAAWSVYVRIVRLALEEKQVKYELVEVDIFAETGVPQEHLTRHPFGRVPAFEHGEFHLYETDAIVRYIDDAFPGCKLQPKDPRARAKVNQIVGILDAYAYRTLVWDIYVERVVSAREGRVAEERKIAAALPRAAVCLSELNRLSGGREFLAGGDVTLADLYAAPMFACFMQAPEAVSLTEGHEKLTSWWQRFAARDSMSRTLP